MNRFTPHQIEEITGMMRAIRVDGKKVFQVSTQRATTNDHVAMAIGVVGLQPRSAAEMHGAMGTIIFPLVEKDVIQDEL